MSPRGWPLLLAVAAATGLLGTAVVHGAEPPPQQVPAQDRDREAIELLASPEELAVFDELTESWRRQAFLSRFWQLRDPFPQTARNELRERWEERAEVARQRFGTLSDDRSRLLLLHGEPAEVLTPRCGGLLRPIELWSWERADLLQTPFTVVVKLFGVGAGARGEVWDPIEGVPGLLTFGDTTSFAELVLEKCSAGQFVLERLERTVRWPLSGPDRRTWPVPNPEWVQAFHDRSTAVAGDARPLEGLELTISFPARRQSRTVMRADLTLPRSSVTPTETPAASATQEPQLAAKPAYRLMVDGEVLRDGVLFDSFRYRFELPADSVGETLVIPVERALRPASYTLALRVRELAADGRESRWEAPIEVPVVATLGAAAATTGLSTAGPSTSAAAGVAAGINTDPSTTEPSVRLLAPSPELLRGMVRVGASVAGPVAALRFELDGKTLMTRTKAPWSVEIDLGRVPKTRRLRAVALDSGGDPLADDVVLLNAGPHRFALRLVEPARGSATGGRVRVAAEVEVPEGEHLDRVEVLLNDDRVATLYQPPFETVIELPQLETLGWIRAVAVLSDGSSAEDLVFVNAPDLLDRVDVDFVELYTTVVDRRGRPVEGLEKDSFTVREDGREQVVRRFELIRDTPLHAAIVLDVSGSMREELPEAEAAALAFFADLLRPTDRASVITFSDQPQLQVRFTNDLEVLAGGLAGLHAFGNTALWDTVVYSLFYFNGIRGKRAMVLISDGEDSGSRHSFEEALDFAKRSGVAIYTVALGSASRQNMASAGLSKLADQTGGRFFSVTAARDLRGVYARIDAELRSQYLLAYQSDASLTETAFREVEVEVERTEAGKLEARTLRGYFP